jgi:site-specific DNA-methyltransferase (adenine-specific)
MLEPDRVYCMDVLDGLRQLDDRSVDLVVTSPPYNVGIEYETSDDNKPLSEYYDWCGKWMKEILRVLKDDGRFCLNHLLSAFGQGSRTGPLLHLDVLAEGLGFKYHGLAVWNDATPARGCRTSWGSWLSASMPYVNCPYEGILILYKDSWKKSSKGESTIGSKEFMEATSGVWSISPEHDIDHPAPFPEELAARCINLLSYVGDLVLDPFMGSGTTAIAACRNRRRFIGFDISPAYVEMANKRVEGMLKQGRLEV